MSVPEPTQFQAPSKAIPEIPEDLANDPEYARKFPLNGSVRFLDVPNEYRAFFECLKLELVRDFFIKKITHQELNKKSLITIASDVSAALINLGLSPLSGSRPSNVLYAFYEPSIRSQLSLLQIAVLSSCFWGNVDHAAMAKKLSDGDYYRQDRGAAAKSYDEQDIQPIIDEALNFLQKQM